jgi:hypothetical protein
LITHLGGCSNVYFCCLAPMLFLLKTSTADHFSWGDSALPSGPALVGCSSSPLIPSVPYLC